MLPEDPHPAFEPIIEGLAAQGLAVSQSFVAPDLAHALRVEAEALRDAGQFRPAGIGAGTQHQHHEGIRRDTIHWLDEPAEDNPASASGQYLLHVRAFYTYLNQTCYTGIRGGEFHFAHYAEGSFYRRHLDRFRGSDARKYSVITYLNPQWMPGHGGELLIYLPDGGEVRVEPRMGTTVVFESGRLEHEVLPAIHDRLSITGWLKG